MIRQESFEALWNGPWRPTQPPQVPRGKDDLFPFFEQKIAESSLRDVTYVEPFAGGAGAAIAVLFSEVVDRIVINDLDKALYTRQLHNRDR